MTITFSVITPVFHPVLSELEQCLYSAKGDSVEHILVLDGKDNISNLRRLKSLAKKYSAKLIVSQRQSGISDASNIAAEMAVGEFLIFLDQDDFLEPGWTAPLFPSLGNADFIYSDSYVTNQDGKVLWMQRKPDWSPVRAIHNMYACHFMAVRRTIFEEVGGLRAKFDGSQDHDLALRVSLISKRFKHIAIPLYNWRQSANSTAANPENKSWAYDAGLEVAQNHLDSIGVKGTAQRIEMYPGAIKTVFPERNQAISIVVPSAFGTRSPGRTWLEDLLRSLKPFLGKHEADEIIIVSSEEDDFGTIRKISKDLEESLIHVIDNEKFNFSRRCNIGFEIAKNEHVLLLNDDVEFGYENPLDQLFGLLSFPNVGLVGALLVFPDFSIQHGGHYYANGNPSHAYYMARRHEQGIFDLIVDREVSGVTGALMFQKKSTWRAVGGFSEILPLNFNDVDYCLKISQLGYSIIQANSVTAIHHESVTRVAQVLEEEHSFIKFRWPDSLSADPFWATR